MEGNSAPGLVWLREQGLLSPVGELEAGSASYHLKGQLKLFVVTESQFFVL